MLYTFEGQDSNTYLFQDIDASRCSACGELLDKWSADLSRVRLPIRLAYDVSASYDGVVLVSTRFRRLYEAARMTGLRFTPIGSAMSWVMPTRLVPFDARRRGTRFEDQCPRCGQFGSITGATPVFLVGKIRIDPLEFVRTDLEFGSGDEKHPVILCGEMAARKMAEAELKGLDLVPVTTVDVP